MVYGLQNALALACLATADRTQ